MHKPVQVRRTPKKPMEWRPKIVQEEKKKFHEYCSENAEVSGRNFLISHEEDKALKQKEGGGGNEKMKKMIGKKRSGEVKK